MKQRLLEGCGQQSDQFGAFPMPKSGTLAPNLATLLTRPTKWISYSLGPIIAVVKIGEKGGTNWPNSGAVKAILRGKMAAHLVTPVKTS